MGLHSGKFGRVNGVDSMRQWTINETERQPKAVASNTLLGTARRRGVRSWTGSFQAYGEKPVSMCMPGTVFAFSGYGAPDNDLAGGTGLLYEGDAIVDSVEVRWNWQNGEILSYTVNFSGHLELDKTASGADPGDAVSPNLPIVGGTKIQYAMYDLGVYTTLANLTDARLTISSQNNDYVNSSTYVSPTLWTGRSGGPIDWTLAITQQDVDRAAPMFDIGDFVNLRLFTDASLYWQLKYGIVRDFSGITVNRESGEIIRRTINIDMNGYYGSNHGEIKFPGGTQWWPF
jgi:hypothetical protein